MHTNCFSTKKPCVRGKKNLPCFGDLGEFCESSGRALGELWESSGRLLGDFWESSARALGELWESSGRALAKFSESSRRALGEFWESSRRALGELWESSRRALGEFWGNSGRALGELSESSRSVARPPFPRAPNGIKKHHGISFFWDSIGGAGGRWSRNTAGSRWSVCDLKFCFVPLVEKKTHSKPIFY